MKTKRYLHNGLNCEYLTYGRGQRVLYCFHGFGGSMFDWEVFDPLFSDEFTVFSFSDFFHAKSDFPVDRLKNNPLSKEELIQFYRNFSEENNHQSINIVAHSSGGRTALTLIEGNAFPIEKAWLFAIDGLELSFWNKAFCTYPFIQTIYSKLVEKPDLFFSLVRGLSKLGLLNRSLAKFVLFSMRSEEKRRRVYNYWMLYRKIIPSKALLFQSIKSKLKKVILIMGSDDQVIPLRHAYEFKKEGNSNIEIVVLNEGHLLLKTKHLEALRTVIP